MIRVVEVVGFKKSGKTRVTEGLVRELTRRGHRVGTIKHITDPEFTMDQQGKDTWKHAQAGAKVVVSMAPDELALIERGPPNLNDVMQMLRGLDFLILEGFRDVGEIARIAVLRDMAEAKDLINDFTIASIGGKVHWVPEFGFDDSEKLADLVEQKSFPILPDLECKKCGYKNCKEFGMAVIAGNTKWNSCQNIREDAVVMVDGKRVPMNKFVQQLVANVVKGLMTSLKKTDGKEAVVKVRLDEG